jgi:hypothetical protein
MMMVVVTTTTTRGQNDAMECRERIARTRAVFR